MMYMISYVLNTDLVTNMHILNFKGLKNLAVVNLETNTNELGKNDRATRHHTDGSLLSLNSRIEEQMNTL